MNKKILSHLSRYNKATAAAASQAIVQLIAAFVRFPPELEQAIGIVMTSVMVWLVPNREVPASNASVASRSGNPLVAHLPFPAAFAAGALALLAAGCSSIVPGDDLADRLIGPDCGVESRVFRARSLMTGLARAYPELQTDGMRLSLAAMEDVISRGGSIELPAADFQEALAVAMVPVLLDAGGSDQPIWLSLARLPPVAAELVQIRQQMAAFCASV